MTKDNFLIPFVTGGFSKCLASALLLPINVVRLRLQMKRQTTQEVVASGLKVAGNLRGEIRYEGIWDVACKIKANEGVRGFYKGLTPNMIKIFPTSGLFFLIYETTLIALQKYS
jgi:hypothetical protein